jgi:hypothetical protein
LLPLPDYVLSDSSYVALHARSLGLAESLTELDALGAALTSDELYDSRWMLAYEAAVRGWLASPTGADFVGNDANFSKLRTASVNFYDVTQTALPPLPPPKTKSTPSEDYDLLGVDVGEVEGLDY